MLLWNADNFVFKILLHRNRTFSAISLLRNVQSASNEGFAGRKWMFLCLRGGGVMSILPVYQVSQALKIPVNFALTRGEEPACFAVCEMELKMKGSLLQNS